mgnify:CR=1 FL=1
MLSYKPGARAGDACFQEKRDVVFPTNDARAGKWIDSFWGQAPNLDEEIMRRSTLLFFAGSVRKPPGRGPDKIGAYSLNARQTVFRYHHDRPGFDLVEGHVNDYGDRMRKARFCLVTCGFGWANRITAAMANGCLPLIVMPGVTNPFERDHLLDYKEFSLRVELEDVPRLPEIISAISEEKLRLMRLSLEKAYPTLMWEPLGTAFNTTITALANKWDWVNT